MIENSQTEGQCVHVFAQHTRIRYYKTVIMV